MNAPAIAEISTDFTRIVLPDGNGRTFDGQLGFQVGETIHKGDVRGWMELNGWKVYRREIMTDGKHDHRGVYKRGTCLFIFVH